MSGTDPQASETLEAPLVDGKAVTNAGVAEANDLALSGGDADVDHNAIEAAILDPQGNGTLHEAGRVAVVKGDAVADEAPHDGGETQTEEVLAATAALAAEGDNSVMTNDAGKKAANGGEHVAAAASKTGEADSAKPAGDETPDLSHPTQEELAAALEEKMVEERALREVNISHALGLLNSDDHEMLSPAIMAFHIFARRSPESAADLTRLALPDLAAAYNSDLAPSIMDNIFLSMIDNDQAEAVGEAVAVHAAENLTGTNERTKQSAQTFFDRMMDHGHAKLVLSFVDPAIINMWTKSTWSDHIRAENLLNRLSQHGFGEIIKQLKQAAIRDMAQKGDLTKLGHIMSQPGDDYTRTVLHAAVTMTLSAAQDDGAIARKQALLDMLKNTKSLEIMYENVNRGPSVLKKGPQMVALGGKWEDFTPVNDIFKKWRENGATVTTTKWWPPRKWFSHTLPDPDTAALFFAVRQAQAQFHRRSSQGILVNEALREADHTRLRYPAIRLMKGLG